MGNSIYPQRMTIDRLIVAEPHYISVGVSGQVGSDVNPYKEQVIRIDDGPLKSLVSFTENEQSLHYEFEDNINLKFMKKDNDIVYHLKTDNINYTSKLNDFNRQFFKSISLKSNELDKIHNFFNQTEK